MLYNSQTITVPEFGFLVRASDSEFDGACAIPPTAFDWLVLNGQSVGEEGRELVKLRKIKNKIVLQVVNFVGVMETPCGTRIEILPKNSVDTFSPEASKKILLKMLGVVEKISLLQFHQSKIDTLKQPLLEILISQFLEMAARIIKQGLRNHYLRIEREALFLKGRLLTVKQFRQRPGKLHYFHISHDVFSTDRPENRLLFTAITQVVKWSRLTNNKRLAKELLLAFDDVNISKDVDADFRAWSQDRNLAHYQGIKPWCELILSYRSPIAMTGNHDGISFLFPMEQLFEKYVTKKLARMIPKPLIVKEQARSQYLTTHSGQNWFNLRPDILIKNQKQVVSVIDTKWKLLNEEGNNSKDKYGLSQSDFYQLFAYGENYLKGRGTMYLIYPKHMGFNDELPIFGFNENLNLKVVPYDLEKDECSIDFLSFEDKLHSA